MRNEVYRVLAILGILMGLAVVGVQAQAPSKVQVEIPFEFTVGKTTLPAGVYSIKRLSAEKVTLRSEDGKASVILNAPVSLTSSDSNSVERLVFNKNGDDYVLSQIWLTADSGREVWTNKQKSERTEIALRLYTRR